MKGKLGLLSCKDGYTYKEINKQMNKQNTDFIVGD